MSGDANTFGLDASSGARITRRLVAEEDPAAETICDYTTLEWWRVPERTGQRHITGPYVDYLCTDDYTLTLTAPVFGRPDLDLLGMVGVDIYIAHVETILLPIPGKAGTDVTVINASGRVAVSFNPQRAVGSILRLTGLAGWLRARAAAVVSRSADTAVDGADSSADGDLPGAAHVYDCAGTSLAVIMA